MKDDLDHTDNEVSSTEDTDSVESPPVLKRKIDAFEVKRNYLCIDNGFIVRPNRKSKDYDPTVEDRLYAAINFGGKSGYRYVKALLDENKDLDLNNPELPYYTYPLHYSIILREECIAEELIKRGSNVNLIDDIGLSPLNYSVGRFYYEYKITELCKERENKEMKRIVTLLLLNGANVFYQNHINELYPFREAIRNDFYYSYNRILKRIDFIKERKINTDNQFDQYITMEKNLYVSKIISTNILKHLIDNNEAKALELLENGVKIKGKDIVNDVDDIGQTFLFYAFARGMYSVMRFLVLNDINVIKINKIGLSVLDLDPVPFIPNESARLIEIEKRQNYLAILLEEMDKNNGVLLSPEYYSENLKQKKNEIKKDEDLIQRQTEYNKKSIDDLLSEIDSLDSTKQEKEKETVVNKKKRKKILNQNKKENKEAKRLHNEKLMRMTFLLNKFYKKRAFRIFSEKIKIQKDLEIKTIEMNKSKRILEKSKEKRKKKLFKKITMNIARSKIINTMNRINKNGSNVISKVLKNIRFKKRFIDDKLFFFPFEVD